MLIISVDGLGPDVLRHSHAPNLRELMDRSAFTLSARTTDTVKTLPSHVSMLTGVTPKKHGVTWNDVFRGYPRFPTLMEAVKRSRPGLTTALVVGKAKLQTLARPGSLDWVFVPDREDLTDAQVASRAVEMIKQHQPDVLMVHLPNVDQVGHGRGWDSLEQRAAVARADRAVGEILGALRRGGQLSRTLVIVTADHGGVGMTHEPGDGRSLHIPWIASGPGIRRGDDLATRGVEVHTEDTFATAAWWLGLPLDPALDGHPVTAIERSGATSAVPAPAR
ncbi:MAG: alkaline phosphatase family protein [Myxococcales bacterium]